MNRSISLADVSSPRAQLPYEIISEALYRSFRMRGRSIETDTKILYVLASGSLELKE